MCPETRVPVTGLQQESAAAGNREGPAPWSSPLVPQTLLEAHARGGDSTRVPWPRDLPPVFLQEVEVLPATCSQSVFSQFHIKAAFSQSDGLFRAAKLCSSVLSLPEQNPLPSKVLCKVPLEVCRCGSAWAAQALPGTSRRPRGSPGREGRKGNVRALLSHTFHMTLSSTFGKVGNYKRLV